MNENEYGQIPTESAYLNSIKNVCRTKEGMELARVFKKLLLNPVAPPLTNMETARWTEGRHAVMRDFVFIAEEMKGE